MPDETIRIDELNPTGSPAVTHEFAAMKGGLTVKLTVQQAIDLAFASITGMTVANVLTGAEIVHGLQSGNSRKITVDEIRAMYKGADISDTDIDGSNILTIGAGRIFDLGGTQQIDGIATVGLGVTIIKMRCTTSRTFTHHATDLILPGQADIVTQVGDELELVEYATGDWRCTGYLSVTGNALRGRTPDIILKHELATGVDAGTFNSGSFQTRPFNVEVRDVGNNCVLNGSNQFILDAGEYYINSILPTLGVLYSSPKLYDITNTADVLIGSSNYGAVISSVPTEVLGVVKGHFTLAAVTTLEIQQICNTTQLVFGFGIAASLGAKEVYGSVELWKNS